MLKPRAIFVPSKSICFRQINKQQIINNNYHYTFEWSVIQAYLQQHVPSNTVDLINLDLPSVSTCPCVCIHIREQEMGLQKLGFKC